MMTNNSVALRHPPCFFKFEGEDGELVVEIPFDELHKVGRAFASFLSAKGIEHTITEPNNAED